jgi:hypothetical protein
MAATALSLLAAWLLKARCAGFALPRAPKVSCYGDIEALYTLRGLDHHLVPYLQAFNEYPPVTGIWQWVTALPSHSLRAFFVFNVVGLALLAFATTWVLIEQRLAVSSHVPVPGRAGEEDHLALSRRFALRGRKLRIFAWCLGPPLALYAFYNWDLIPVFLTSAGLLAATRRRFQLSGLLFGLGIAAKWYPGAIAVVVLAALLAKARPTGGPTAYPGLPDAVRFVGGIAAAVIATNLPFLLGNAPLFLQTYTFHLSRPPNPDTLWGVAAHYSAGTPGLAAFVLGPLQSVLALALVGGVLWVAWLARQGRLDMLHASFAALLVFVLLNKVFSIQYALWVLPFFAILEVPWLAVATFWLASLAVDMTQRGLWEGHTGSALDAAWTKMAPWIILRHAVLAWMLWWVPGRGRAPSRRRDPSLPCRASPRIGGRRQAGN